MSRFSSLGAGCIALLMLSFAGSAAAQSAADKATARRLATEGIELHSQGKYAEALERLQRAEALYDAPVHLLYIARVQAKLGQLVEASETYRRLIRVQLDAAAPAAFRDAVEAGKREVGDVEAKIGSLRIDVDPQDIAGLELSVDGQKVSAAAVGVERPANPGRHVVSATAPGYRPAEESVDIGETEKKSVRLTLEVDPNATPATPPTGEVPPAGGAQGGPPPPDKVEKPPEFKDISVILGLRIGAAIPGGSIFKLGGSEVGMSDFVSPGVGLEVSAGAWFARYFGAKIFLEGYGFTPGEQVDTIELPFSATVTNQAMGQGLGIAVMGGTPLNRYGLFGELGFSFVHGLTITREFEAGPDAANTCGRTFDQTLTFSGAALRAAAGARLPVAKFLHLTPFVLASFGQYNKLENENTCEDYLTNSLGQTLGEPGTVENLPVAGELPSGNKASHQLFLIGLGGDFVLGLQ